MATEASAVYENHGVTIVRPNGSSGPEPIISALLEQQAEIQAKLAVLLPQKFSSSVLAELNNLRHKLRVLRAFADDNCILDRIPVLSEVEEARQLQYQTECIEAAFLDNGYNIRDCSILATLESIHHGDAPPDFGEWLRKNLSSYDPVTRQRNNGSLKFRGQQSNYSHQQSQSTYSHSYKCPDENCLHYVYGFVRQEERDQHSAAHIAQEKRDSGLSVGAIPPLLLSSEPEHYRSIPASISPAPLAARPLQPTDTLHLPPLPKIPLQTNEQQDLLRSYSFALDRSTRHVPRDSIESEIDPLLPPLKHNRVGPSRLKSIEELKLLSAANPCFRCRLLRKRCDSMATCFSCSTNFTGSTEAALWKSAGCQRVSPGVLADILVPTFLAPDRAHTPMASPLAQRRSINALLEMSGALNSSAARVVLTNLDFDDGFWWTEDLAVLPSGDPSSIVSEWETSERADGRPPPILWAFASSWSMGGTAYNIWQLLKLSGLLSISRRAEASLFPILYQAKLLLREVLFFDLQQPVSSILLNTAIYDHATALNENECYNRRRVVCRCMAQFLHTFEEAVTQGNEADSRSWLAMFFSTCLFSIVRTILVDMTFASPRRDASNRPRVINSEVLPHAAHGTLHHATYKLLVMAFTQWSPVLLDEPLDTIPHDDHELFSTVSMIIKKNRWSSCGISSTKDFLMFLGALELDDDIWHGFIRQRSPQSGEVLTISSEASISGESQHAPPLPPPPMSLKHQASDSWANITGQPPAVANHVLSSPKSVVSESNSTRKQTLGRSSPTFSRRDSQGITSPMQTPSIIRPSFERPPLRRVYCTRCNEYPEGFRGEHELRRHTDAKHAALVRRWVCVEPRKHILSNYPLPAVALSKCKSCVSKKRYGAYYNAAAHLRRAHFSPLKVGKVNSEWPPMTILKDWMQEVRHAADVQDDLFSSDCEDIVDNKMIMDHNSPTHGHRSPHGVPWFSPTSTSKVLSPAGAQPSSTQGQPPVQLQQATTLAALQPKSGAGQSSVQTPQAHLQLPQVDSKQMPSLQISREAIKFQSSLPLSGQSPQPLPVITTAPVAVDLFPLAIIPAAAAAHHRRQGSPGHKSVPLQLSTNTKAEDSHPPSRNRCPYPECGRVFKDISAHMLTHMEERPEKCPIETCEYHVKGFARKYDKNRHALTHYKGTMVCPFCHGIGTAFEKAFNRADVFKRHLTAVHNVEQTPPNSKKTSLSSNASRLAKSLIEGTDVKAALAKCSICTSQFLTAQEFYEHLDDCVLNVIVPSTPRSMGASSTATSTGNATVVTGPNNAFLGGATTSSAGLDADRKDLSPTKSSPTSSRRIEKPQDSVMGIPARRDQPLRHLLPISRCGQQGLDGGGLPISPEGVHRPTEGHGSEQKGRCDRKLRADVLRDSLPSPVADNVPEVIWLDS